MKLNPQIKAFTLVELLVVITIIATLAGIAFPVYNTVQEKGKQTKALTHAKQIGLSCKIYAADYDGAFPKYKDATATPPEDAANSSDAFTSLIKGGYIPDENLFYVQGSAYCSRPMDNNKILEPEENNYAYFWNINDTDTPSWPLIADGWASDSTYTDQPKEKGGVWKGKKAIVIRVDMSGKVENLNDQFRLMGKVAGSDTPVNILEPTGTWMGTAVKAMRPDGVD